MAEKDIDSTIINDTTLARKLHSMLAETNPRLIKEFDFNNTYPIKPTQTLLLYNVRKTLKRLPNDCSRLLIKVITALSPLKSLEEISLSTEMSLDEIIRWVKHLLYWKQGKLIYPIRVDNIYRVSSTAVLNNEASKKFDNFIRKNSILPSRSLEDFLFIFSMTQKEKDKIKNKFPNQNDLYQIIAYLMRNNLIWENFYYYYLMVPLRKEIKDREEWIERRNRSLLNK